MKKSVCIFILLLFSATSFAQVVSVEMKKTDLKRGEKINFDVVCLSEQDLEISVFSNDCLVTQQKSTLIPGTHPFSLGDYGCSSGKFFVLITGNGIHVEKEFNIRD